MFLRFSGNKINYFPGDQSLLKCLIFAAGAQYAIIILPCVAGNMVTTVFSFNKHNFKLGS